MERFLVHGKNAQAESLAPDVFDNAISATLILPRELDRFLDLQSQQSILLLFPSISNNKCTRQALSRTHSLSVQTVTTVILRILTRPPMARCLSWS